MLHTVLLSIAFVLFLTGATYRESKINFVAIGLAVLSVAMFVGQDLHIHLHLNGGSSGVTYQPQMTQRAPISHSRS